MDNNELKGLLYSKQEGKNLDYKAPLEWKESYEKASLTKDILAMSNTCGYGVIIIGVSEDKDTKKFIFEGLKNEQLKTFDPADVENFINNYATGVNIGLKIEDFDGKEYVFISVKEPDETPIYCKKDYQKDKDKILQKGVIYIREGAKSIPINNTADPQGEMRKLLDLAVEKKTKNNNITTIPEIYTYEEEKDDLKNEANKFFKAYPDYCYWQLEIYPKNPLSKDPFNLKKDFSKLREAIEKIQVKLKIEEEGFFPSNSKNLIEDLSKGIKNSYEFQKKYGIEFWKMYFTGYFSYIRTALEDTENYIENHEIKKGVGLQLENIHTMILSFMFFIRKYFSHFNYYQDEINYKISILNCKNRGVYTSLSRIPTSLQEKIKLYSLNNSDEDRCQINNIIIPIIPESINLKELNSNFIKIVSNNICETLNFLQCYNYDKNLMEQGVENWVKTMY